MKRILFLFVISFIFLLENYGAFHEIQAHMVYPNNGTDSHTDGLLFGPITTTFHLNADAYTTGNGDTGWANAGVFLYGSGGATNCSLTAYSTGNDSQNSKYYTGSGTRYYMYVTAYIQVNFEGYSNASAAISW